MKQKENKNAGYILLESLIAFLVVTIIVLEIVPVLIFMRQQQVQGIKKLDFYRHLYELTVEYTEHDQITFGIEERGGISLSSSGEYDSDRVDWLKLEMIGEKYEIIWQESR